MLQVIAGQESQRFGQVWLVDAALVVGSSLLMAVCAHVAVPLWFTPVPTTLQTFGVMLLALTLGGWRAAAALVLCLLEGVSGAPIFSPHGAGGVAQLFGPTGGYLMAYPFAALAGGRKDSRRPHAISRSSLERSPAMRLSLSAERRGFLPSLTARLPALSLWPCCRFCPAKS